MLVGRFPQATPEETITHSRSFRVATGNRTNVRIKRKGAKRERENVTEMGDILKTTARKKPVRLVVRGAIYLLRGCRTIAYTHLLLFWS